MRVVPISGATGTIFVIPDGCNTPGRMPPVRFHVHKAYKPPTKDITAIYTIKFFSFQLQQWTRGLTFKRRRFCSSQCHLNLILRMGLFLLFTFLFSAPDTPTPVLSFNCIANQHLALMENVIK